MKEPKALTLEDFSSHVAIDLDVIKSMAANTESLYKPTRFKRKKNGIREIDPPTRRFRCLSRKMHRFLSANYPAHRNSHGGVKKHSAFTSAQKHQMREIILTFDIKDCYPSINRNSLLTQLLAYGFTIDVATVFSFLMTRKDRIPQGSPLSGDALNFHLYEFDCIISEFCSKNGGRYTRFCDDIVISLNDDCDIIAIEEKVILEISKLGLMINQEKRNDKGIQYLKDKPLVHNLVLLPQGGLTINEEQRSAAQKLALSYYRNCKSLSFNTIEVAAIKRRKLVGHINHMSQANQSNIKGIRSLLHRGDEKAAAILSKHEIEALNGKWWNINNHYNEPKRIAQLWKQKYAGSTQGNCKEYAT